MRIYISVDMEGASGVTRWQDVVATGADYQRARSWMTGDVNAAIAGARGAGATDFVVEENHGVEMLCNLLLDEIDPAADVVRGIPRGRAATAALLDASFDAMFLVGHHGKVGERVGICAHTISYGEFVDVRLDGRSISEGEIFATIAAQAGVPTALVTGDDVVAAELEKVVPGIETAIVKRALSRTAGVIVPPRRAHRTIRDAARRAVERVRAGEIAVPAVHPPFRMEIELRRALPDEARATLDRLPELTLDGTGTTVSFAHEEMATAYAMAGYVSVLPSNSTLPHW